MGPHLPFCCRGVGWVLLAEDSVREGLLLRLVLVGLGRRGGRGPRGSLLLPRRRTRLQRTLDPPGIDELATAIGAGGQDGLSLPELNLIVEGEDELMVKVRQALVLLAEFGVVVLDTGQLGLELVKLGVVVVVDDDHLLDAAGLDEPDDLVQVVDAQVGLEDALGQSTACDALLGLRLGGESLLLGVERVAVGDQAGHEVVVAGGAGAIGHFGPSLRDLGRSIRKFYEHSWTTRYMSEFRQFACLIPRWDSGLPAFD